MYTQQLPYMIVCRRTKIRLVNMLDSRTGNSFHEVTVFCVSTSIV